MISFYNQSKKFQIPKNEENYSIIISKIYRKKSMRRKSVKKSSMFKVQADKTIYKRYLDQISECASVRTYPHLLESIQRTSNTIFNYCYDFSDETPFSKGMNYGCKNYGLSSPSTNVLVIRQWIPNAKEVYLLGDFNQFNQTSHQMTLDQDQPDIFSIQLDITKNHIIDESRITLKIVDTEGKVHKMPPPSCKIRDDKYGYICNDIGLPVVKHQKKHDVILAYTIDLLKTPLSQVLSYIESNEKILNQFNTIIIRSLFDNKAVLDKGSLTFEQAKLLRDIVIKVKNQMGLRIIIQWSLQPGTLKYGKDNPIEKQTMKEQQGGLWHYDLKKPVVTALYLANLSYYLSVFQINGFHFKHVDSFCKDQHGQVLVKCLNIMNHRLQQNGFTLASCKKQVPGLNQPILQGGLGFTFTYNYNENFIKCKSHIELRQKFDKILQSSNCVAINLDELTLDDQMNFLFAVLVSGKGIFCKGSFVGKEQLIDKLFTVRKQPQLFNNRTKITKVTASTLSAERGNTIILFNFSDSSTEEKLQKISQMEIILNLGRRDPTILQNSIKLQPHSCCILEKREEQ